MDKEIISMLIPVFIGLGIAFIGLIYVGYELWDHYMGD